ncbi:lambda-crystallin homolog [Mizuhopecten yessoensis]|uniref:L-gulonate 3-dehydrogenase n=1 Tax=Mizuhopecten yessoensis TaxID=6573 RepID=A0A210Q8D3_MIZYE|nr:lambda-crystallin homolog [Mizuhopecten yessoensis]OWF45012.1 Lambda-crystallin-like [Mizuhopecten yessoensis]
MCIAGPKRFAVVRPFIYNNMACSPSSKQGKVAIVGSGLIGQNWSMIFAGAGYHVTLYDTDMDQLMRAKTSIKSTLEQYERDGYLRGKTTAVQQNALVSTSSSLSECLSDAFYVQECVPENLELKKKVFKEMDTMANKDMILASSSSCLCASMFTEGLTHKSNMLVAHPINPPYFIPLVELVPAPWTNQELVTRVRTLMEEIGQSPITLRRESLGFALNRIQYAAINESWNMYQSGLLSAEDIDRVCHDGLGLRYAFIGPLETMHLNANGIADYCERYAEGAYNVQKETFKPVPVMYDVETAMKVQEEFSQTMPLDKLAERRSWRDKRLAEISKLKKTLEKENK